MLKTPAERTARGSIRQQSVSMRRESREQLPVALIGWRRGVAPADVSLCAESLEKRAP